MSPTETQASLLNATATESTLRVSLDTGLTMLNDREAAHRMVMELWGQLPRDEFVGARSKAAVLWGLLPFDMTAGTGRVLVRSSLRPERMPRWIRDASIAESVRAPESGRRVSVRCDMVALKTPASSEVPSELRTALKVGADGSPRPAGMGLSYRRNPVPVPPNDQVAWATARMRRNGLEPDNLEVTSSSVVHIGKRHITYPVISVRVTGQVTDGEAFAHAWRHGMGKGKSYGYGMLITK